ncbi:MAG TPA: hypothetical protein DCE56_16745 [Cyanobacteria bacterium UBA8553]|nr:hypothetical protein [Cyanobacteria bacterium UBA8553]
MKTRTKIIAIALSVGLIVTAPPPSQAKGFDFGSNNPFSKLWEQFTSYFNQIQERLQSAAEKFGEGLQADIEAAMEQAMGDLNIPGLEESKQAVEESIATKGDATERNDVVAAATNGEKVWRTIVEATVAAGTGPEGQQRTQEQIELTKQSVEATQQLGEQAQNAVSTQDVLKNIANQMPQIASTLGQMRSDNLMGQFNTLQTNAMLKQIDEKQAKQQATNRLHLNGLTSYNMELTGWTMQAIKIGGNPNQ